MSQSNSSSGPSNLNTPPQSSTATPASNPSTTAQQPVENTPSDHIIVALITAAATIIVALIGYASNLPEPSVNPTQIAYIPTPSATIILTTTPSTIVPTSVTQIPPTPSQVTHLTSKFISRTYWIRFVARPIPVDELHNVYYSVDNSPEKLLFPAGRQVDHQFSATFSRSIRVRVDIKPGTVLHEELYVNGDLVTSSENADNTGLTYQVP